MSILPGFELDQEVDITFRGARVTDIGGNFIDVELSDGEELTVLPGADGVEVTPAGAPQPDTVPATEVLDLLAAIREALTVPHPASTAWRDRELVISNRATAVRAVISNLVDERLLSDATGVGWWADHLRRLTAETPVTYPVAGGGSAKGERATAEQGGVR